MKKFFTMTLASMALTFGFNTNAAAQVEEGNMIIDLYYGFPNSSKTIYSTFEVYSNFKSTGMGPVGGRFEYMIADNLGVGVDVNFVSGGAEYDDTVLTYNGTTGQYEYDSYTYTYNVTKLRIMARMNYHFVSTDVVDAYVGFGAGYKLKNSTFTSSDPNGGETTLDGGLFDGLFPLAARVALGSRFFFTENIGVNMELGLGGGPLVCGGVSVKF